MYRTEGAQSHEQMKTLITKINDAMCGNKNSICVTPNHLFWLNVGIVCEFDYVHMVMSSLVVADFIYRMVVQFIDDHIEKKRFEIQDKHVIHPFSVAIDRDLNELKFGPTLDPIFREAYASLTQLIKNTTDKDLDMWDTFTRKIRCGKKIVAKFAKLCFEQGYATSENIFEYIKQHSYVLVRMLQGVNRNSIQNDSTQNRHITNEKFHKYCRLKVIIPEDNDEKKRKQKSNSKPTKKERKKPKQARPHSDHLGPDRNIKIPETLKETLKPGIIDLGNTSDLHHSERTFTEELQDEVSIPPIFDGDAEKYVKHNNLPVIVVETFRNHTGELVKGITNTKDKRFLPGSDYINDHYYRGETLPFVVINMLLLSLLSFISIIPFN
jgi:hypothetical protein